MDGYAPVYALMEKASGSSSAAGAAAAAHGGSSEEERVQMGLLRVVLALEERGPAVAAAAPADAGSSQRRQHTTSSVAASPAKAARGSVLQHQPDAEAARPREATTSTSCSDGAPAPAGVVAAAIGEQHRGAGDAVGSSSFRQLPEYLVAWELEVWKKVCRRQALCFFWGRGAHVHKCSPPGLQTRRAHDAPTWRWPQCVCVCCMPV